MTDHRYNAFKLGFVQALVESGEMEKTAANLVPVTTLPITPDLLFSPLRIAASAGRTVANTAGAGLAYATGPTKDDEDLAKMEAETAALREQEQRLKAEKQQRLMRHILAQRVDQPRA